MATTKNIIMKQFNGTDYDTLYPKTVAAQIDDVYSKNETYSKNDVYTKSQVYSKTQTLADATKTLYGLSSTATPNDALAYLGQYNQYWWRRCGYTPAKIYFKETGQSYAFGTSGGKRITYFYNVSVDVNGNLTISLTGETYTYSWGFTTSLPNVSLFKGKYFSNIDTITGTQNVSSLYYGADNISIDTSSSDAYYVANCKTELNSLSATPTYSYEYLKSNNSNAYPVGFSGNYYYEKIGQPLVNLPYYSQIATGSYEGTGVHGEDNPNTLTFNFVPKVFFIIEDKGQIFCSAYEWENSGIWIQGSSGLSETRNSPDTIFTVNGNTLSWYHATNSYDQFNASNKKYCYVALG